MNDPPATRIDPPPFQADPDLARVMDALPGSRIVGGAVRDVLARRAVADIDLATPWPPDRVDAALRGGGIRTVATGIAHGTITAVTGGRRFEVTTLRRDVETDGRHAVVAFTEDWRADAERRDFTMNALSMARDGAVFDYFCGLADLAAGRVRFVGDAAERIAEDYLRVLRFFRFHARYGRTEPDEATRAALRDGAAGLSRLSIERVWYELARLLSAPDPVEAVRSMAALGVLARVLPEGADPGALSALVAGGGPNDPVLRLAALLLDGSAEAAALRLKLSSADRERLIALSATSPPALADDDAELRRALANAEPAIVLGASWRRGPYTKAADGLRARIAAMARPVLPLDGKTIVAMGVPAGPAVGRLLAAVRRRWVAGGCVASRADCEADARRLASVSDAEVSRMPLRD